MKKWLLASIICLASCSQYQATYTDRCNSERQCRAMADATCNGHANIISITNPEGENEEPLFGGGVSVAGAILGSVISDAADAALGQLLEVHYSCEKEYAMTHK